MSSSPSSCWPPISPPGANTSPVPVSTSACSVRLALTRSTARANSEVHVRRERVAAFGAVDGDPRNGITAFPAQEPGTEVDGVAHPLRVAFDAWSSSTRTATSSTTIRSRVYRALRDEAPCYRNDELGFWALSRYDDVVAALHDPDTYCSRFGITLEDGNPLPMMLTTDPPDAHGDAAAREPGVHPATHRRARGRRSARSRRSYLDAIARRRRIDLITDYAALLPMDVISQAARCARRRPAPAARVERRAAAPRGRRSRRHRRPASTAATHLFKYFGAFVADRRAHPGGDDFTAALIAAEPDGEALTDKQVVGFCFLLIIAGNETTTKLLGNCAARAATLPVRAGEGARRPRRASPTPWKRRCATKVRPK